MPPTESATAPERVMEDEPTRGSSGSRPVYAPGVPHLRCSATSIRGSPPRGQATSPTRRRSSSRQFVLADLHALRRLAEERVQFSIDERGVEHAPPLLDILTAIVAAQERGFRLREKMIDPQSIPAHIVDAFVQNAVNVISQYVDPRDLSAALDKLRDMQARVVPPSRGPEK